MTDEDGRFRGPDDDDPDYDPDDPAQFDPVRPRKRVSYAQLSRNATPGEPMNPKMLVAVILVLVIAAIGVAAELSYECASYHAGEVWNPGYDHDFILEWVCPK